MFNKIVFFIKNLSEKQILLLLLLINFSLRLYAVLMAQGMAIDSTAYGFMARDFLMGAWVKGLSSPAPPFYPLLIFLFSPDATYVEMVGRWISLAFGTFAMIPMFYLMKQEIGQKEAVFSALLYAFHPYLVTYSGMLLTEATYGGLLILSVYFFWKGLKKESAWRVALSGCFLGLAYLTRPEGIGYVLVYLLWIIVSGGIKKKWLKKLTLIGVLTLTILIFVFPYLLYIRQETGQWLISKKAIDTQSYLIKKNVEEVKSEKEIGQNKPGKGNSKITWFAMTLVRQFPSVFYHYLRAYHFSLWFFLIFGLIRVRQRGGIGEWLLTSIVLFHLFSLSIIPHSSIRFSIPVIPLSLFWAGAGILEMKRCIEKLKTLHSGKVIFLLILLTLIIQMPQSLKPERGHRALEKKVGLWLKQNTPPGAMIMSNSPQEVFYAEREFVMFPSEALWHGGPAESYREMIRYAKNRGIRYILVDKNTQETNPGFIKSIPNVDLKEIYSMSEQSLTIYEVMD